MKANLTLPDGTEVSIDGGPDEVRKIIQSIQGGGTPSQNASGGKAKRARPNRAGPQTLIEELAKDGFFGQKRTIGDIQKELAGQGHIYAQNNLSGPLVRLVRARELRRIKENSRWVYVNP